MYESQLKSHNVPLITGWITSQKSKVEYDLIAKAYEILELGSSADFEPGSITQRVRTLANQILYTKVLINTVCEEQEEKFSGIDLKTIQIAKNQANETINKAIKEIAAITDTATKCLKSFGEISTKSLHHWAS